MVKGLGAARPELGLQSESSGKDPARYIVVEKQPVDAGRALSSAGEDLNDMPFGDVVKLLEQCRIFHSSDRAFGATSTMRWRRDNSGDAGGIVDESERFRAG